MNTMRATASVLIIAIALSLGVACGGDGDAAPKNSGAAVAAVAAFFIQERDGARLPEGVEVRGIGIESGSVRALDIRDEDKQRSVKERFCMEYRYQEPDNGFKDHLRVYVAELIGGAWAVSAVNPDGTCEGVA